MTIDEKIDKIKQLLQLEKQKSLPSDDKAKIKLQRYYLSTEIRRHNRGQKIIKLIKDNVYKDSYITLNTMDKLTIILYGEFNKYKEKHLYNSKIPYGETINDEQYIIISKDDIDRDIELYNYVCDIEGLYDNYKKLIKMNMKIESKEPTIQDIDICLSNLSSNAINAYNEFLEDFKSNCQVIQEDGTYKEEKLPLPKYKEYNISGFSVWSTDYDRINAWLVKSKLNSELDLADELGQSIEDISNGDVTKLNNLKKLSLIKKALKILEEVQAIQVGIDRLNSNTNTIDLFTMSNAWFTNKDII